MSYTMKQQETSFFISSADVEPARLALREACDTVDWFKRANARHLENAVGQFDWELVFDDDDNVVNIKHCCEYLGNETILFHTLAPFVKPGSFIQMLGEDGELWRWVFNETICKEIKPTINWSKE